jgi:hypothetical protein
MSDAQIQVEPIDLSDEEQVKGIQDLQRQAIADLKTAQGAYRFFQTSFDTALFTCRAWLWSGILTGFVTLVIAIWAVAIPSPNAAVITAVLAALSAASFLGVYVMRPLDSLERNAMLVPLVAALMSSFWFRFALANNDDKLLKKIANDLALQIGSLIDKHSAATAKYIEALSSTAKETDSEEEGESEDAKEGDEGKDTSGKKGGKTGDVKPAILQPE